MDCAWTTLDQDGEIIQLNPPAMSGQILMCLLLRHGVWPKCAVLTARETFATKCRCLLFVDLLSPLKSAATAQSSVTLILSNGNPSQPEVQAVAIAGNRILAAGNSADIPKLEDSDTQSNACQRR